MIVAALTLTIAVSALFGVLQIIAGGLLARRLILRWRWRVRSITIGALAGLWLLVSGIGEFIVAIGETLLGAGEPTARLRAAIDGALLATTLALAIALVVYLIALRLTPSPK